jgi:hypothetical protein
VDSGLQARFLTSGKSDIYIISKSNSKIHLEGSLLALCTKGRSTATNNENVQQTGEEGKSNVLLQRDAGHNHGWCWCEEADA